MQNINNLKLLRYRRKSTESEDKQVASLEDQGSALKRLEETRGISIQRDFSESKSAKQPGRLKFNEMLAMIESGEADGIVCWHVDRLSRNPKDSGNLMQLLQDGILKVIVTPNRDYLPDDDALPMALESAMANKYSRDLSRNVIRGLNSRAEKGIFPVGQKPGYLYDPFAERGSKKLIEDPERFDLVQQALGRVISGEYSPPEVLEWLNKDCGYKTKQTRKLGGKHLSRSVWYTVLSDPFYYGEYEYPKNSGKWYHGIHKPMITKEQHDRIQIMLGKKTKPRPIKHSFAFSGGLMTCGECSAAITAEDKWQCRCTNCHYKFSCKNTQTCPKCETDIEAMDHPVIRHYIFYRCTKRKDPNCSQGAIEEKVLVKQINDFLSKIQISKRFQNWLIKKISEDNELEVYDRKQQLKSVQAAYHHVVQRLDRLREVYVSPRNKDGLVMSEEEYLSDKTELVTEKKKIKKSIDQLDIRVDDWSKIAEEALDFAREAKEKFENGDNKQKRSIFRAIGLNQVLKGKKLYVEDPSLFLQLKKAREEEPSISPTFEPAKTAHTRHKVVDLEELWDRSPALLPG